MRTTVLRHPARVMSRTPGKRPADLSVSENLTALQREMTALNARVTALRSTHAMYPDDAEGIAEAALAELEYAERLLAQAGHDLAHAHSTRSGPRRNNDGGEGALLRAVSNQLTGPVVLLDQEGYIRRINNAGARQCGRAPRYLTSQPLASFVDAPTRADMQSRRAAGLRGDGPTSLESRVAKRAGADHVHLCFTRLDLPTGADPLVRAALSARMT